LEPKDASTLYFISDTRTIYLGEEIYGSNIEISDEDGNIIELTEDGLFAGLNLALEIGPENTDEEVPSAAATYEALVSVAPFWVGEPIPDSFFDGKVVDMPALKQALEELSPVTGVKGAEEADFRTGEVELSPADLGAETTTNKTVSLSAGSTDVQYPTAKAVYDAVDSKVDKSGTDRLMTAAEGTKLSGIATGAQVNPTIATEAEAKTGTDNTKMMTPLVSKKAVDAAIAIKANRDNTLQSQLYAQTADALGNPAVSVTGEKIFVNPPLPDMGSMHYEFYEFVTPEELAAYQAPITDDTVGAYNVLTMARSPERAVQIAIQTFETAHSAAVMIRTRHIDDLDFTRWQPWKKLAYQEKVQPVQIILPNGITTSETSYCVRDQFGMVHVVASVYKEFGFSANDLAFTLPEGYRPASDLYISAPSFFEANSTLGFVNVKTTGEVICQTGGQAYMICNATFIGA
jgi:hypothetical protein